MAGNDLNQVTGDQRNKLVNLMLEYINDDILLSHHQIDHIGAELLDGHRAFLARMEDYLQQNEGGEFVPLPYWDPANPIPAEFNAVKPADDGTERPAMENLNPNMPLPSSFRGNALCDFSSAASLGNAINGWHGMVHVEIGGVMGNATISPAAPIFWCWHRFLDNVYKEWEACPSHPATEPGIFRDLPPQPLPSGEVTPQLFREWAEWAEHNLDLQ